MHGAHKGESLDARSTQARHHLMHGPCTPYMMRQILRTRGPWLESEPLTWEPLSCPVTLGARHHMTYRPMFQVQPSMSDNLHNVK